MQRNDNPGNVIKPKKTRSFGSAMNTGKATALVRGKETDDALFSTANIHTYTHFRVCWSGYRIVKNGIITKNVVAVTAIGQTRIMRGL